MGVFGFARSISGKVFLTMAAIGVALCIVGAYAFIMVSSAAIGDIAAGRDEFWTGCVPKICGEIDGLADPAEIDARLDGLMKRWPMVAAIEVVGANGAVLAKATGEASSSRFPAAIAPSG